MRRIALLVVGLLLFAGTMIAQTKDSTVCAKCVPTSVDSQSTVKDSTPVTVWSYTTLHNAWRVISWRDSVVKVPVVTPPPVTPPAAGDTVFAQTFDGAAPRWDDATGSHTVVSGGHIGKGYQVNYTAGTDENGWFTTFFGPGYDSLYARVWVKLQPGWVAGSKLFSFYGSRSDNLWSAMGKAGVCPSGSDFFTAVLTMDPASPYAIRFYANYPGMPTGGGCFGEYGPLTNYTPPNLTLSVGAWHKVEFWVRLNRIGQRDGLQRVAVDDTLRGEWTGIEWRKDAALKLNSWTWSASSYQNQVTKSLVIDDILVSRQNLMGARPPVVTPPPVDSTPKPPVDTLPPTADTGAFALPNVLNNASFESGWDGFLSGSATTPNGAITRSTERAFTGTTSVKVAWKSGGEIESQAFYDIGSPSHFWTRYWYYLTALPNGTGFKFVRYQDGGFNVANGMQILNGKWVWVGNTNEAVAYTTTSPIIGGWHSVEFEWDRSTKQVRMWQDGTPMTGGATDAGLKWSGATLTYTSDIGPRRLDLIRIINARTNSGTVYLDRIAVSTKGRIGP